MNETQRQVLRLIAQAPQGLRIHDLALALRKSKSVVRTAVRELAARRPPLIYSVEDYNNSARWRATPLAGDNKQGSLL